jgi:hypothetical protein
MKKFVSIFAALCLCGCLSACNQNDTAQLVSVLGIASASIAQLEGNATLSTQLKNDTAAAVSAVENWKQGDATQSVEQTLNIVESDLALFPVTDQFAPLIDLAIGTVENILQIVHPTAKVSIAHTSVSVPKTAKDFKKSWNEIVSQHPELSAAKIK